MSNRLKAAVGRIAYAGARAFVRYFPDTPGKGWASEQIWRRIVGRRQPARIVGTVSGFRMMAEPPDLIQTTILFTGTWEPGLARHIASSLRQGDVFVDIGANVGHHTLVAAKAVGASGRVFAFEASPFIHTKLSHNISLNGFDNVVALQAAVANGPGKLNLWQAPAHNLGHSTTLATMASDEHMALEAVVDADSLDRLVPHDKLFAARLIKIDVEGAERHVLEPLGSMMSRFSFDTEWLVELAPEFGSTGRADVAWICKFFRENGYTAYVMPNSYDIAFYLRPLPLRPARVLTVAPPSGLTDVLFSRRAVVQL